MGSKPSFEKTEIKADWIFLVVFIDVVRFKSAKIVILLGFSQNNIEFYTTKLKP